MITLASNNRLETLWNEVKRNSIIPQELYNEAEHQLLSNRLEVKVHYAEDRIEDDDLQRRLAKYNHSIAIIEPLVRDASLHLKNNDLKLIVTDTNGVVLASQAEEDVGYCCPAAQLINSDHQLARMVNRGANLEVHYDNGIHSQLIPIFDEQGKLQFLWGISDNQPITPEASNLLYLAVQLFKQRYDYISIIKEYTGSLMNAISDYAIMLDENYRIINVNESCQDLFRLEDKRILNGMSFQQILANQTTIQELDNILSKHVRQPFAIHVWDEDIPCQLSYTETINTAYGKHTILLFKRLPAIASGDAFSNIIGGNQLLKKVKLQAQRAAQFSTTVLIEGESGTGKEMLAEAIHHESRRTGRFVAVNCGAIPAELIQSELFGYTEGAFTGARRGGSPGKIEIADGGTLFLDEIGEMPLDMQVSLLRFLQDKKLSRVGSSVTKKVDVRIIAATNRNLQEEVQKGNFREDIYYRLKVIRLELPPLRDRKEDIPLLANFLLDKLNQRHGLAVPAITATAMEALLHYDWPGNVRELENEIEQALIFASNNEISFEGLIDDAPAVFEGMETIENNMAQVEKEGIEKHLRIFQGNITQTANALGITRQTLYKKIKTLNINREAFASQQT